MSPQGMMIQELVSLLRMSAVQRGELFVPTNFWLDKGLRNPKVGHDMADSLS